MLWPRSIENLGKEAELWKGFIFLEASWNRGKKQTPSVWQTLDCTITFSPSRSEQRRLCRDWSGSGFPCVQGSWCPRPGWGHWREVCLSGTLTVRGAPPWWTGRGQRSRTGNYSTFHLTLIYSIRLKDPSASFIQHCYRFSQTPKGVKDSILITNWIFKKKKKNGFLCLLVSY